MKRGGGGVERVCRYPYLQIISPFDTTSQTKQRLGKRVAGAPANMARTLFAYVDVCFSGSVPGIPAAALHGSIASSKLKPLAPFSTASPTSGVWCLGDWTLSRKQHSPHPPTSFPRPGFDSSVFC